jgi:putative glycosyltransferase
VNGDGTANQPDISVITTMYRSEPYIEEFYRRVVKTIQKLGINSYEIVFVDDGSPDRSRDLALQLYARDPNVVVVDLSRRSWPDSLMRVAGEFFCSIAISRKIPSCWSNS